jgi:hypothetical protein
LEELQIKTKKIMTHNALYFNYLGKKLSEQNLFTLWQLSKKNRSGDRIYFQNPDLGVELITDVKEKLNTIFLYGRKEGKFKPFTGEIPFGITFKMSQSQTHAIMGKPTRSGEKGGVGIMAVERSWDKWENNIGQAIRVEYTEDEKGIFQITLMDTELEISTLYDGIIAGSHHSIYIQDIDSQADAGEIWNTKADARTIAHVGDKMVGISIPRYAETYLTASLYSSEIPISTLEGIDHCNEFSIKVTRELQIGNYFAEFHKLNVPAGIYRVRVMCWFLDSVKNDEEGDDRFSIEMWADGEIRETVILK